MIYGTVDLVTDNKALEKVRQHAVLLANEILKKEADVRLKEFANDVIRASQEVHKLRQGRELWTKM